jgi:hypothetical protein
VRVSSTATIEQARLRAGRARVALLLRWRARDAHDRPLPDFLVIGAQKSGTSSLYARLVTHPQVLPALRKEVHWFDGAHADRDNAELGYRAFFPTTRARADAAAPGGQPALAGEATPFYLVHPGAPRRAARIAPDAKLVVVLRDPVMRAVSGYHHAVRFGHEQRPIDVALDPAFEEPVGPVADDGWWDDPRGAVRVRGYLERGRYAPQLRRWWEAFSRDRTLVIEDTSLRGDEGIARACEFLGLLGPSPGPRPDRNVGSYQPPPDAVVDRLRAHFAPFDEDLAQLLGTRPSWMR